MAKSLEEIENELADQFKRIDDIAFYNQKKVLNAFKECKVSSQCFSGTTGYGYGDLGRDRLGEVFAKTFNTQKAIVSPHLTCGTHTISTVLYGLLRHGDMLLSITGLPYDTIQSTIFGKGNSSLEDYGIIYKQIDLKEDSSFDVEKNF